MKNIIKKINLIIEKNINKIFISFLLLHPIIDAITTFSSKLSNIYSSVGLISRGLILILMGYCILFINKNDNKNKIKTLFLINILYFIIFISIMLAAKGINVMKYELRFIFKAFYFPILLLGIISVKDKIKIEKKHIIYTILLYCFFFFLSYFTKIGFKSYGDNWYKTGFSGWYYAAMIGNIIAIVSPIFIMWALNLKNNVFKIIYLFIYVLISLIIGTKVPFLGVLFTLVLFFIFYLYKIVFLKETKYFKTTLFIVLGIIFLIFSFKSFSVGKNLIIHLKKNEIIYLKKDENNKVDKNNLINDKNQEAKTEKPIVNNKEEDFQKETPKKEEKKPINFVNIVFSSRDIYFRKVKEKYKESNIFNKLFGLGFVETNELNEIVEKPIEMDFFDIYFRFGILGFILFLVYPFYLLLTLFSATIKTKSILNEDVFSFYVSFLLSFGIALIAGHNLIAPAVSIYTVIIFALLNDKLNNILLSSGDTSAK